MNNDLNAFIEDLRTTHGENLAAVILYGSAAAGDFNARSSDLNLLVALCRITPLDLRNAHACTREWVRLGHPVPVYFTVDELQTAADVFPIEFHQMERARRVVFGTDVLAGITISDKFLRHQTEYELRSRLIQLRRSYIPASRTVPGLARLMSESLTSFAAILRALLLLKGIEPPAGKHAVVARVAEEFALDGKPFEKIFNIRENNFDQTLTEVQANELFAEYLTQIERAIAATDQLRDL
jgi:predicted nucleotidyltransferase